jgi:MoaA/NifB/PqqE/SkfB family radical SAM enzyme
MPSTPFDTRIAKPEKLPQVHTSSLRANNATAPSDLDGRNGRLGALHEANARLSEVEYSLQRLYLHSMPRYLTIVIGDGCNIDCPHCYQSKAGDNLLRDSEISPALRREFSAFYPYLSTLRLQGGEVFAIRGFRELVDDVGSATDRPLISISTNGTLIDQAWAERIVQTPFQSITVSFDGGTQGTFEKLRRGARFPKVIENITRLQELKRSIDSSLPRLDTFFVLMRSNYREILPFLALMKNLGIYEVAFQTMLIDARNLAREPGLVNEVIKDPKEVCELYSIVLQAMAEEGPHFLRISWSGLHSLFKQQGLDPSFLDEENSSLYPDQPSKPLGKPPREAERLPPTAENAAVSGRRRNRCEPAESIFIPALREVAWETEGKIKLCPNPWSMMFVAENGDVLICFLAEPVGNLYESPLLKIWNGPRAIAKRSEMIQGRYLSSGCSKLWCDWRDGKACATPTSESRKELLHVFKQMRDNVAVPELEPAPPELPARLGAVRRLLENKERRILELEASLADLWEKNGLLHDTGQSHVDHLEKQRDAAQLYIDHLDKRRNAAQLHIDHLEKQRDAAQPHIDHLEKQRDAAQPHIDHLEKQNRELLAEKQRLKGKVSSLRDELKSLKRRPHWPMSWLQKFR